MAEATQPTATSANSESPCLIAGVVGVMDAEPALEAVRIDRTKGSVSVATLGRHREEELEQGVLSRLRAAHSAADTEGCQLLRGSQECGGCGWSGDQRLRGRVTLQDSGTELTIARVTCPTAPNFWRWRSLPYPVLVPRTVEPFGEEDYDREWRPQLVAAALCGLFAVIGSMAHANELRLGAYLLAYLAGSWFTSIEIWERLRERVLDVHFLMLAVAMGSASIGAWGEGATLLFLFSFSGALEHYALGRTQREIKSLFREAPKTATRVRSDGREETVPVDSLRPGMRILVRPGDQFPVDAEVVRGSTAADESNLTGEAMPVEKQVGDSTLAGTINLWGVVEVSVLRQASQSALQRIVQLIRQAQHLKAPTQRLTDRFGTGYTYLALGLCLVMFFVWWAQGHTAFVSTGSDRSAFYRAMTLLVVASPCALVLSIPSAILAAIAFGARRGVLFRGGAAVEKLAEVTLVALDKTGTLTTGELQVEAIESFPPGREIEVAELAFSLERLSNHPLARAITRYGKQRGLKPIDLDRFQSQTGLGLEAWHGSQRVWLGKREWVAGNVPSDWFARVAAPEPVSSEVWIAKEGLLGRVILRDDLRPQAKGLLQRLRAHGSRIVVLTGDRQKAADHLRRELELDECYAELSPEAKVGIIADLAKSGHRVAMVGDGVNDAPSLAAAHVGVAMGARGADAALEQAEVVLMHDRLENFLTAFELSGRARRVIRQNLFFSLGTVVVLVGLALLGWIPLTVGVVGHEGSTVIVVLNSLRLLFAGRTTPPIVSSTEG